MKHCNIIYDKHSSNVGVPLCPIDQQITTNNQLPMTIKKFESVSRPFLSTAKNQMNDGLINVKLNLDSGMTVCSPFNKSLTVRKIKENLANVLEMGTQVIEFHNKNGKLSDSVLIHDVPEPKSHGTVTFRLKSLCKKDLIINNKVRKHIPSLDVITVHLPENKDVVVEIEDQSCVKEWLGGYHHMVTGQEYHNAYAQTQPRVKRVYDHSQFDTPTPLLFHRDTQTQAFHSKKVSTTVSQGSQTCKSGCYIHPKYDKIITSKPFRPYSYENSAITIQRYVRGWLKNRRIFETNGKGKKQSTEKETEDVQVLTEQLTKEQRILIGMAYPSKQGDFYALYLMIENWLEKDRDKIISQRTEAPRKSCNYLLLLKEIEFLFWIEKHRIEVKKESLKKEEMRFLEMTARPKTFKNSKGQITSVDDRNTQKARDFKEIYSHLTSKETTHSNRVNFLMTFKHLFTSQYMTFEYANDLVSLINQEIDFISIGAKDKDLKGLRLRIEQLYLHFLHLKDFNLNSAKYKKSNWPKTIDKLYQCNLCKKLLPPSKFSVHLKLRKYQQCTSCDWLHNVGHHRVDMGPFLKLLRQVQSSEVQKCCSSSVPFILQETGMSYLTNTIWHGRSAISSCCDLTKLCHVRWLNNVDWAPWNTILLTAQEAEYHFFIPDVLEFYDTSFVETVHQRHMMARIRFTGLLKMDHYLRSNGVWQTINDSGPYFHPSHADKFATKNLFDKF